MKDREGLSVKTSTDSPGIGKLNQPLSLPQGSRSSWPGVPLVCHTARLV